MSQTPDWSSPVAKIPPTNPIGLVEEYTLDQDWNAERTNENELWSELPSQWGSQRLWVVFHDDTEFLQFNCYLNLKIPSRFLGKTSEMITLINERVWLGHFEIWAEETVPVFRIVLPLRGAQLTEEQLDDIMAAIFQESTRFFPAFQWIIWGGKSAEEAVTAAIIDTEGEA
jgi:hypothetical protein